MQVLKSLNNSPKLATKVILVLISALIVLIRYPDFLLYPRVWAEELIYLEIFLSTDHWIDGFNALVYPSYYVFSSRLASFFASLFPIEYAALILSLFGLFVLLMPILIISLTQSSYWNNAYQKIILLLFYIFACSTGEFWINSTNTGFILSLCTLLIILDDNIASSLKAFFYSTLLVFGFLSGPISLIISPFLLIRYYFHREKVILWFIAIAFIAGSLHLSYLFITSTSAEFVGNTNRGHLINLALLDRTIYWMAPNIIFPIFGYLISKIYRNFLLDSFNNPVELLSLLEEIGVQHSFVEWLISFSWSIALISIIAVIYFIFLASRHLNRFEFLYLIGIFLVTSIVVTFLSLGGQGGFKYSLPTSFLLLFILKLIRERTKNKFRNILLTCLIMLSIVTGIAEYQIRLQSYTPLGETNFKWPNWRDEIIKWKNDETYKPKVWPFLKTGSLLEPKRTDIWEINLNEPENWNKVGNLKYTEEVKKIFLKN